MVLHSEIWVEGRPCVARDDSRPTHHGRAYEPRHHEPGFQRDAARTIPALTDAEFNSLYTACDLHTGTRHHDDPTVAACFVADRLDLSRVGFRPDPGRMPAPPIVVDDAFIEAAMERERKRLAWPGGAEIEPVWGVRPG